MVLSSPQYDAYPRADSSAITGKAIFSLPILDHSRFHLGTPFLETRLRHIHDFLPRLPSRSPRFSHLLTSISGMRRGSARWRDTKESLQRGRARRRRGKLPPNHGPLVHRNHAQERARRHQLSIGHSLPNPRPPNFPTPRAPTSNSSRVSAPHGQPKGCECSG